MRIALALLVLLLTGCQALPQLVISSAGAYQAWEADDRLDRVEKRLLVLEKNLDVKRPSKKVEE